MMNRFPPSPPDPTPSCDGTPFYLPNGMNTTDDVLFYAPMALGPGNPNTLYFGTDRLYRSIDKGDTMLVSSQAPLSPIVGANPPANNPVTAIAISPQDDNVRLVATQDGKIFTTSTGVAAMTDTNFPPPTNAVSNTIRYVGRLAIDPKDKTTGYATLAYYFNPANASAAHVWKVTNLNTVPVWTQLRGTDVNVIPNIPVNAFAMPLAQLVATETAAARDRSGPIESTFCRHRHRRVRDTGWRAQLGPVRNQSAAGSRIRYGYPADKPARAYSHSRPRHVGNPHRRNRRALAYNAGVGRHDYAWQQHLRHGLTLQRHEPNWHFDLQAIRTKRCDLLKCSCVYFSAEC